MPVKVRSDADRLVPELPGHHQKRHATLEGPVAHSNHYLDPALAWDSPAATRFFGELRQALALVVQVSSWSSELSGGRTTDVMRVQTSLAFGGGSRTW